MATGFQESNLARSKWIYDEFQTFMIDEVGGSQIILVAWALLHISWEYF